MTNKNWTLFLDRDGVINKRLPNRYVESWDQFEFTYRCLEAIKIFKDFFQTIVVVTNQQGIGKGIMTKVQLETLHKKMLHTINTHGGFIHKVYYCPDLKANNPPCRKPNTGMGWQAQRDFPTIDFQKSIMVGDSFSDMEFGWQLGMKTVFIEGKHEENERTANIPVERRYENLWQFAEELDSTRGEILVEN
ncbi:MAG: HAD family hydrolase [Bacteroidota bacterium]